MDTTHSVTSAVKAIILRQNQFLIIKQKVGSETIWDLPGGKIEYGENPFQTLQREVKEEIGIQIDIKDSCGLWWFFHHTKPLQVICHTYFCQPLTDTINLTQNPTKENIIEYQWVTKKQFLSNQLPAEPTLKNLLQSLSFPKNL